MKRTKVDPSNFISCLIVGLFIAISAYKLLPEDYEWCVDKYALPGQNVEVPGPQWVETKQKRSWGKNGHRIDKNFYF